MGADDVLVDDHILSDFLALHDRNNLDFVFGDVLLGDLGPVRFDQFTSATLHHSMMSPQGTIVRRSLFSKHGPPDGHYRIGADYVFTLKCWGDPATRKRYWPRVIAQFGITGISSTVVDHQSYRDLPMLIEKHLGQRVSWLDRIHYVYVRIRPRWWRPHYWWGEILTRLTGQAVLRW